MSTDSIMQHAANQMTTLSGYAKKNGVTPQTVSIWMEKSKADDEYDTPQPFFVEGSVRLYTTADIDALREKYGQKPKALSVQALRIQELESLVAQYEEKLSQGAVNYAMLENEKQILESENDDLIAKLEKSEKFADSIISG